MNDDTLLMNSGIVNSIISDHFPIFIDVVGNSSSEPKSVQVCYSKRIFNDECKQIFTCDLSQVVWNSILNSSDAEDAYKMFTQNIIRIFDSNFLLIQKKKENQC